MNVAKEDLVKYKAIDRGWTKRDLQRVGKKLRELAKDFDGATSIEFDDIDTLAFMLEEEVNYKLEYSLIRLAQDGKISLAKRDSYYIMDILNF